MSKYFCTNSERSCALSCPHKWLIKYGLGIVPDRPSEALYVGTLWHQMMDAYWRARQQAPLLEGAGYAYSCALKVLTDWRDRMVKQLTELSERAWWRESTPVIPTQDRIDELYDLLQAMIFGYMRRSHELKWIPVAVEEQLVAQIRTPSCNRSPVSWYAGKVDLVVRDNGAFYLVEHKTTAYDASKWRERHDYNAQVSTYALLWSWVHGQDIRGIVYDVAQKSSPASVEDYKLLKSRPGVLSKQLPANATYESFRDAIKRADGDEQSWYVTKLEELKNRSDPFFARETVLFGELELERARKELYYVTTTIRRWANELGEPLCVWADELGDDWRLSAVKLLDYHGTRYPRNPDHCYQWNRPCEVMDVCRYQDVSSFAGYRLKERRHEELEELV